MAVSSVAVSESVNAIAIATGIGIESSIRQNEFDSESDPDSDSDQSQTIEKGRPFGRPLMFGCDIGYSIPAASSSMAVVTDFGRSIG